MNKLEEYYNKFNEDKRLNSRHGQVEFLVTMKYLHQILEEKESQIATAEGKSLEEVRSKISILDVGAGTGRYAIPLSNEGYDVTAVEPVHHNLGRMKQNGPLVKAYEGRAEKLKRFSDNSFDVVLLFGPLYHLKEEEQRQAAISEAKRVVKPNGFILISYIMNEYSVLMYGFKDRHIKEAVATGMIDEQFRCTELANPLYHYMRLEDIYALSDYAKLERVKILSADGPANHIRTILNALDEEEFRLFVDYQMTVCERPELLGAAGHILDILVKRG